ncbi:MAG: TonB-dependent receptor domain-containing protein, partial [Pseudomonadales bacterium]
MNLRVNHLEVDRIMGGANGGGQVVLNESGQPSRVTDALVPGWRFVDPDKNPSTAPGSVFDNDFFVPGQPNMTRTFTDPVTGAARLAQRNRAGIDFGDFDGFQNAAASLDGFNQSSPESIARLNNCVFPGSIDGDDVCVATNGVNEEDFKLDGTQFNVSWDVNDRLQLKYLFGWHDYSYQRITDDDNTASPFQDRQFYVNHEMTYRSHELQAFFDVGDSWSFTSGVFFYRAKIDQRGDYSPTVGGDRFRNPYVDNTALSAGAAAAIGAPFLEGISASALAFGGAPMVDLFSARRSCEVDDPAPSCQRNFAVENTNEALEEAEAGRNDNLQTSAWMGDDGTNRGLDVVHGPNTEASDLLYATQTKRKAFAAYTQGVWDINPTFSLTLGLRYAEDELTAEENLWRYSETGGDPGNFLDLYGGLAAVNIANGGLVQDADGNWVPTPLATNGGIPFALSVYRPFERTDKKWGWRVNLDHHITQDLMLYYSATKGHRSGGYNLVFFSATPTYGPEELVNY